MMLKNLLILGMFGVAAMGEVKAAPNQAPVLTDTDGGIQLVSTWCGRHPHKCHRHHHHRHPYFGYPYGWYHKDYGYLANHCRYHPLKGLECKRFCKLNPRVCFP